MKPSDLVLLTCSELTGAALNWAVAKAFDVPVRIVGKEVYFEHAQFGPEGLYCPSESWEQAGPIIESNFIRWNRADGAYYSWIGGHNYIDPMHELFDDAAPRINWDGFAYGDTLLQSAMRCFVCSKLGEDIGIPKALI